jgi:hypothetical protein
MHDQTLADSEGKASAPNNDTNAIEAAMNDNVVSEEAAVQTTQSKKRKTMTDSFELGMKAWLTVFKQCPLPCQRRLLPLLTATLRAQLTSALQRWGSARRHR